MGRLSCGIDRHRLVDLHLVLLLDHVAMRSDRRLEVRVAAAHEPPVGVAASGLEDDLTTQGRDLDVQPRASRRVAGGELVSAQVGDEHRELDPVAGAPRRAELHARGRAERRVGRGGLSLVIGGLERKPDPGRIRRREPREEAVAAGERVSPERLALPEPGGEHGDRRLERRARGVGGGHVAVLARRRLRADAALVCERGGEPLEVGHLLGELGAHEAARVARVGDDRVARRAQRALLDLRAVRRRVAHDRPHRIGERARIGAEDQPLGADGEAPREARRQAESLGLDLVTQRACDAFAREVPCLGELAGHQREGRCLVPDLELDRCLGCVATRAGRLDVGLDVRPALELVGERGEVKRVACGQGHRRRTPCSDRRDVLSAGVAQGRPGRREVTLRAHVARREAVGARRPGQRKRCEPVALHAEPLRRADGPGVATASTAVRPIDAWVALDGRLRTTAERAERGGEGGHPPAIERRSSTHALRNSRSACARTQSKGAQRPVEEGHWPPVGKTRARGPRPLDGSRPDRRTMPS